MEQIQRLTTRQCAESETLEHSVLSRMSPSNPSTQSSVNSVEDGMKNVRHQRNKLSRHCRIAISRTRLHRSKPDMVPVLREGTQVPPLARSYLQMITALKRENYFLKWSLTGYIHYPKGHITFPDGQHTHTIISVVSLEVLFLFCCLCIKRFPTFVCRGFLYMQICLCICMCFLCFFLLFFACFILFICFILLF